MDGNPKTQTQRLATYAARRRFCALAMLMTAAAALASSTSSIASSARTRPMLVDPFTLKGKVRVVKSFGDYKVEVVSSFADL